MVNDFFLALRDDELMISEIIPLSPCFCGLSPENRTTNFPNGRKTSETYHRSILEVSFHLPPSSVVVLQVRLHEQQGQFKFLMTVSFHNNQHCLCWCCCIYFACWQQLRVTILMAHYGQSYLGVSLICMYNKLSRNDKKNGKAKRKKIFPDYIKSTIN